MGSLSCVMYHYISDPKDRFYKQFKTLSLKEFKNQLDYLEKNFIIISPDEAKNIIRQKKFKKNFVWLTFDDGYFEHFKYVLPELKKRFIKASFFPVSNSMMQKEIISANLIHVLLACNSSREKLYDKIKSIIFNFSKDTLLFNQLISKIKFNSRYDDQLTFIIKQLLQKDLNLKLRSKVLNKLIKENTPYEKEFLLKKMYFNLKHAKEIIKEGHELGMHTVNHHWLNSLNYKHQAHEIKENINIYKKNHLFFEDITFCYPYGAYNSNTLKILKKNNIKFGVTTSPEKFYIKSNKLLIPRFDTNDFLK